MENKLYFYKAVVHYVYDGDTCTASVDLGFNFEFKNLKLRLFNIDAPELRGETLEAARKSRDFLKEMVIGKEVFLETIKDAKGKYGRFLSIIWIKNDDGSYVNVNEKMVEAGHAIHREY